MSIKPLHGGPSRLLTLVCLLLPATPGFVVAEERTAAIEEIFVTARKREEPLQQTPVAVTALTGESLERVFATDITDLHVRAPNVIVSDISGFSSSAAVFIRGIGNADIDSTVDPPVAIFIDGIYIPRPANNSLDLFDVEQIEILRGPQGTLFGRNTTGGAIHYRTKRPTGEFGARGSVTVGEYGRRDIRMAAEAPIVEDKLAAKIAIFSQEYDGYFKNTFTGTSGNRATKDQGGTDSLTIRPTILFTPNDTFDLTIIGEYIRERSEPTAQVPVGEPTQLVPLLYGEPQYERGEDVRTVSYNVPGYINNDIWGITVEANWDVWGGTLTSVSNYRETDSLMNGEVDNSAAPAFEILRDEPHDQISTELRFAKDLTDNLNLITGLYYFEQDYFLRRDTFIDVTNSGNIAHINAITGQEHTNLAFFAQVDYNLTDRLRFTLGGRYTKEDKDFYATLFSGYPNLSQQYDLDEDWSNFGPKVGVDYQFSDNGMVYASYSKGFKSGGFNGRSGTPFAFGPFDEEKVDAYEIGLKADWLDKRLRTNVALFWNDYKGLQRTIIRNLPDPDAPNPQETLTENAADATVKGFELEVVAIPVTGLQLNLAVGYNDAGYEEFFADINGDGTVTDNSDIPLQRAPEWTIGAGLSYDAQLGNMGTAVFTADFSHVAKQNNLASGVPKGEIGSYELLDMSVTWRAPSERYYATFYVKNVTDEVYQASITAVGALFDTNLISAPRRWGLTVGFDL
ncbi:MAG TPA: TonB-dependent receptor [Pseudomonadales bacterium]|jgi:iron complex outermembrane receptor protein